MARFERLVQRILAGVADRNLDFGELCFVLDRLGFSSRIRGGHHIYYRDGVDEILNLQSKNGKAKPYQVKQVRNVVVKYGLSPSDEKQI